MNRFRIIGGNWRSRKLAFPDGPGLRPTPDRVRETVFNWLQTFIAGADCLDLFAGSGAMGFESLSRQANSVTMVDNNPLAVNYLKDNAGLLGTHDAIIKNADSLELLDSENSLGKTFDIVFLDPPYHKNLVRVCCEKLACNHFLKPLSYIYIESEKPVSEQDLPPGFTVVRNKKAGNVHYHLIKNLQ